MQVRSQASNGRGKSKGSWRWDFNALARIAGQLAAKGCWDDEIKRGRSKAAQHPDPASNLPEIRRV